MSIQITLPEHKLVGEIFLVWKRYALGVDVMYNGKHLFIPEWAYKEV